jgi:phosphatidylethanolamine-binding protein (PEBP) family uncharacterized protein
MPDTVLSYAVTLVNVNDSNRIHWIVYDIPTAEFSLAAGISQPPTGATIGPNDYGASTSSYRGPCPTASQSQIVELKVWAVRASRLSSVSGVNLVDPASIVSALERTAYTTGKLQVVLTQ